MPGRNFVGPHWLRNQTQSKSVRQKFVTGPQFNKRKNFKFPRGTHVMCRRIMGDARPRQDAARAPAMMHSRSLPGDVRRRPDEDYTFEKRVDFVEAAWAARGNLKLHHVGGGAETFVCFRCGYPVRSRLQVIKNGNWDYRMCYHCYTSVVQAGDEGNI